MRHKRARATRGTLRCGVVFCALVAAIAWSQPVDVTVPELRITGNREPWSVNVPTLDVTGNREPFVVNAVPLLVTGNREPFRVTTQGLLVTGNRGIEEQ